jgi:hypothetical protein
MIWLLIAPLLVRSARTVLSAADERDQGAHCCGQPCAANSAFPSWLAARQAFCAERAERDERSFGEQRPARGPTAACGLQRTEQVAAKFAAPINPALGAMPSLPNKNSTPRLFCRQQLEKYAARPQRERGWPALIPKSALHRLDIADFALGNLMFRPNSRKLSI